MTGQRGQAVLVLFGLRFWRTRPGACSRGIEQWRQSRRITSYGVLRVFLGLVLLTAAGLKVHWLATERFWGTGFLESRPFPAVVVVFEWLLGVWLLADLYPRAAWAAAAGAFSCFAVASAWMGVRGESSCGCFGQVNISPWLIGHRHSGTHW